MMTQSILVCLVTWIWLAVCAFYDWQHGEVPNWLTIPGMAAGVLYAAVLHQERLLILIITFIILLVLFLLNGIGGADVKVLTALAGLWPAAMFAALLVQGTWGLLVLIVKGRGVEFKAIPAYALGASLSALLLI